MNPIRLGIVGGGRFFRSVHGSIVQAQPDRFQTVALYDPDPDRSLSWAQRLGAAAYESLEDLFSNRQVELLFIASENVSLRFDAARRALEAGFPVVLDRPMAGSTSQCDELIRLSRRRGTLLTVAHLRRWDHPLRHLAERLNAGALGETHVVQIAVPTPSDGPDGDVYDVFDFVLQANRSGLVEVSAAPRLSGADAANLEGAVLCRFEKPPAVQLLFVPAEHWPGSGLPRLVAVGSRAVLMENSPWEAPDPLPFYDRLWAAVRERGPAPILAADARNAVYLGECIQNSLRQDEAVRAGRLLKPVE